MSSPSVLIIGASGFLGIPVSQELLRQKSHFTRVAILTEASKKYKFESIEKEGIELVIGSVSSPASFKGFDTVFCLLGNHGMKLQPEIIDAAIAGGVTEFYPSEYGSDMSQGGYLTNRYFRDKQITRKHLKDTVKKIPGFNFTLIMVGGFVEFALKPLFGVDVENHTFTFYGTPEKEEALTATADVAKYIVESALLPKSATGERAFRCPGGSYKWKHVIDAVSKAQGVEYTSVYFTREDALAAALECEKKGDVDGELAYSLKAVMGDPNTVAVPKPWDNDKFSFKPESLEVTLKRFFSEI